MIYVKCIDLSVSYGKNIVLDHISFEIKQGDRIGIIGKNGAGKTTFIESLIGVSTGTINGNIYFDKEIEKNIKIVFQNYWYDSTFNLSFLYKYFCKIAGLKPTNNIKELFDKYELGHCLKRKFKNLSGGEAQKFKLLMCLELQPKLIILDEITTSLDYRWRTNIITIINNYINSNYDAALIMISHDLNELKALTKQHFLIKDKKIFAISNLDYFFKNDENWK